MVLFWRSLDRTLKIMADQRRQLLDLDADILCEGHFGIYKTKKDVKNYILSYRRQYGVE